MQSVAKLREECWRPAAQPCCPRAEQFSHRCRSLSSLHNSSRRLEAPSDQVRYQSHVHVLSVSALASRKVCIYVGAAVSQEFLMLKGYRSNSPEVMGEINFLWEECLRVVGSFMFPNYRVRSF